MMRITPTTAIGMRGVVRRRDVLMLAAAGLACGAALAQTFPSRPVTLIVPVPPGGASDIVGRTLAERLADQWSVPVIVDNRPGATGMIGATAVARSKPDGQMLLLGSNSSLVAPLLYQRATLDPDKDLVAIVSVMSLPMCLVVHPSLPVGSLRELVDLVRRSPGKYSYASTGSGGVAHLSTEAFKTAAGLDILHVPYKGAAPALQAVLSNEVSLFFDTVAHVRPFVEAGKLRMLAVAGTASKVQGIPTFVEAGYADFSPALWLGLFAPAATPRPIVEQINRQVIVAMRAPQMQAQLAQSGAEFVPMSPSGFQQFVVKDQRQSQQLIKQLDLKLD